MKQRRDWSPWGLANMLTVARILITPLFLVAFYFGHQSAETASKGAAWYYFGALVVFGIACLTDFLDGRIARKQGVTEFGKFFDPIADKLLVLTALISLKYCGGFIPIWMIGIIAGRELLVTLLRSALVARVGKVVSASQWGKYKTAAQMLTLVASILLLLINSAAGYRYSGVMGNRGPIFWMMWVPMLLTVVSGMEFLYNNRVYFRVLVTRSSSVAL